MERTGDVHPVVIRGKQAHPRPQTTKGRSPGTQVNELELTVGHQALFQEAEDLLEKWKHPDPYRPPTAPGGSFPIKA